MSTRGGVIQGLKSDKSVKAIGATDDGRLLVDSPTEDADIEMLLRRLILEVRALRRTCCDAWTQPFLEPTDNEQRGV